MDTDALLEFLGIRSRPASGQPNPGANIGGDVGRLAGPGSRGAMPVPQDPRFAGRPGYNPSASPADSADLMAIFNRNRTDPAVDREVALQLGPARAEFNQERAGLQSQISATQEQARLAELALLRNGMGEVPGSPPGLTPDPTYAHTDRAGPPLQNVAAQDPAALDQMLADIQPTPSIADPSAGMPQYPIPPRAVSNPLPQQGRQYHDAPPPNRMAENPVLPTPQYTNASAGANMITDQLPQGQVINAGPFQTMAPPNPFEDPTTGYMPGPAGVPIPRPAPDPNYRNNRAITLPFADPSAASARPQTEGMPMLSEPVGVKPLNAQQAFAPSGPLVDAFMSGNAPRPAPALAPRPVANGGTGQVPLPPMPNRAGPDTSTVLNQQELARFLSASGGGAPPPPAPSAPAPTPMASAPAPAPAPIPPGATAMSPPPPPGPGQQMPEALKEALLAAAYGVLARNQQSTQGPPR